jgi:hypothetical protein
MKKIKHLVSEDEMRKLEIISTLAQEWGECWYDWAHEEEWARSEKIFFVLCNNRRLQQPTVYERYYLDWSVRKRDSCDEVQEFRQRIDFLLSYKLIKKIEIEKNWKIEEILEIPEDFPVFWEKIKKIK